MPSSLLRISLTVFIAQAVAFAPVHHHQSKKKNTVLIKDRAFTYEDWHASLHPLDILGVEDFESPYYYYTPGGVIGWKMDGKGAGGREGGSSDGSAGGLIEVVKAFLPVAILILFEITYDLQTSIWMYHDKDDTNVLWR